MKPRCALMLALPLLLLLLAGCSPPEGPSETAAPASLDSDTEAGREVAPSGDIVHTTATGKRYHRAGCRHLARSDLPMTREEAEGRGLTPCRVCKP